MLSGYFGGNRKAVCSQNCSQSLPHKTEAEEQSNII